MTWYLKAMLQGLAPAQFNLGCRYHDGISVAQKFIVALSHATEF
jgi:TPR repeat protein